MKTVKFRIWNGNTMDYSIMTGKYGTFWINAGKNNDGLDERDSASLTPFNTKCAETTELMQSTGFKDELDNEIFERDILSDWNNVDGKQVQSFMQVFWCEKSGAWKLDHSFNQDKSSGDLLCEALSNFSYEITGNVYQRQSV